jgi:hypothetical protein
MLEYGVGWRGAVEVRDELDVLALAPASQQVAQVAAGPRRAASLQLAGVDADAQRQEPSTVR